MSPAYKDYLGNHNITTMKRYLTIFTTVIALLCFYACGTGNEKKEVKEIVPLNITIFLDLSDRLERSMLPSQMERDTAIINMLVDRFVNHCVEEKILPARDHIKVMFYPAPENPNIVQWANNLEVDMGKMKKDNSKKQALLDIKEQFDTSLSAIYKETLDAKQWIGCDVWDFFSNGKVDVQCIREDYRNIVVILSDGYFFYAPNKVKAGEAYSYVLPQTLAVPGSSLICKRKGLSDLEVLVLEVNPYSPAQRDRLFDVLTTWFTDMEVGKLSIVQTDLPSNVAPYIENFLK